MTDRIQLILKSMNLSPSQFADAISVQRSSLSHILSGRNKPSLDFVLKVLTSYPDINPDWLLFGKGTMMRSPDSSGTVYPPSPESNNDIYAERKDRVKTPPAGTPEDAGPAADDTGPGPAVDQIVVLYRDGTFKTFRPARP